MLLIYITFIILTTNLIPQVLSTSYECGEPGVDRLTDFTPNGNTSVKLQRYKNGSIVEYKCIHNNDELIYNQTKQRICLNGKWKPPRLRCAKNLDNTVIAEYMQLLDTRKNVNQTKVKLYDKLGPTQKVPYLAQKWPEDCELIDIKDANNQLLVIKLNSTLFLNFVKLSLLYTNASLKASKISYNDIKINVSIHPSMKCRILRESTTQTGLKINSGIVHTINIKCKIINKNETKFNTTHELVTDQIRLKFSLGKSKFKNFNVGLCGVYLYRYPTNDCGRPDRPLNSHISSNVEEGYTQFTCDDGYEIMPKTTSGYLVTCDVNSDWNKESPICVAKSFCPPIPTLTKGSPIISYINAFWSVINGTNVTTVNTIANHSCQKVLIDGSDTLLSPETSSPLRTCIDGKWTSSDLKCVPDTFWNKMFKQSLTIYMAMLVIVILFCSIVILIAIIFVRSKRASQIVEQKRDMDLMQNHNYYESVRLSNVSNGQDYDYVYECVEQTEPRLNNNSIYEMTDNGSQREVFDKKSDIIWSLNGTYN